MNADIAVSAAPRCEICGSALIAYEGAHPMAARYQHPCKVAAGESGCAGDKVSHVQRKS